MSKAASGETWKDQSIPLKQYEIASKELDELRGGKPNVVWETICTTINTHITDKTLNIIDVGCASGYFYEVFTQLLHADISYMGVDYSEEMIKLASKNYPGVNFSNIDIRNIDLPDKSYDLVFSNAVLEHVPEWQRGLDELCRIANKYLILSKMPAHDGPFRTEQREIYGGVPVFFNKFDRQEIIQLVLNAGFNFVYETKTHPSASNIYRIFIFKRGS